MEITEARKRKLIDMDLDISNLFKGNEVALDTSVLYIRATGDMNDDSSAIVMSCSAEQMVEGVLAAMVVDDNFKNCVLDAVSNFLIREKSGSELPFFLDILAEMKSELNTELNS
jgi:hypothetical protein